MKKERFRTYDVQEDTNLRSFVEEECHLHYEPRRIFFEFFSDEEDISKDKEIILMNKVRECMVYYCGQNIQLIPKKSILIKL